MHVITCNELGISRAWAPPEELALERALSQFIMEEYPEELPSELGRVKPLISLGDMSYDC